MLRLEFTQNLPAEVPSKLKIFSLEKARADRSLFVNVLSRLGLTGGFRGFRWRNNGGWTTAESKDARVSINHHSGAVRFWTRLNDREVPHGPFSIDEPHLAFIARNFLKKTGLVDTPVDQLKVRKIAYLRMQAGSVKGKVTTPRILDAGVIFGREMDGVPVSGPGGYVMINVAPDESVIAGTKVWRRLGATLGMANILKPDYAINELSRRLRFQAIDRPVRVLKAEFCYFERGENDEQNYFEPAYAFVYEYETKQNRFPYKSAMVIPAVQGSRQIWNPPKRFRDKMKLGSE
jgi:hypothetical protein